MMHNDWKRTMQSTDASQGQSDGEGIRLLRYRQLVGDAHEATKFLNGAKGRVPEVARFVDRLPAPVIEQYSKVFLALDGFEDWLETHRDITFHYPEMWPPGSHRGRADEGGQRDQVGHARTEVQRPAIRLRGRRGSPSVGLRRGW